MSDVPFIRLMMLMNEYCTKCVFKEVKFVIQQLLLENGKEIKIKRLTTENLNEILLVQRKVIEALTTDTFLQPLSEDEFSFILNGNWIYDWSLL